MGNPIKKMVCGSDDEGSEKNREVRKSEEFTKALLNNIIDGIITINEQGLIQSVNPAVEKIFGYTPEELIGHKVNTLMPEPYRTEHDTYLHNYLSTGVKKIIGIGREVRGRRKDGSEFPLDLAVSEMWINGTRMFAGILRDISERKKGEEAIARLASIVDSSSDAIIGKSAEGVIFSWNKGAQRLYGYSAGEAMGRHINLIVPEEKREEHGRLLERIRLGERVINYETKRLRKDGKIIDVALTLSPVKEPGGKIAGYSAIARDITDKKMLERQKNDFYAMVTHDIKSPLTVILGYAEFLLDNKKESLDEEILDMMQGIHKNGKKIAHMVEDFLTISRLESEWIPVSPNPEDIASILRSIHGEMLPLAGKKNIEISLDEDSSLPPLYVDRRYISRAIGNLVQNAIKYTPEGGKVTIGVCWEAGGQDSLAVTVSDTGPGIPRSDQAKIFEKYFRSKTTAGTKGSGLGLAIAKAVIEAHCGRIELDSEPGLGSTFKVVLPLRACERSKTAA